MHDGTSHCTAQHEHAPDAASRPASGGETRFQVVFSRRSFPRSRRPDDAPLISPLPSHSPRTSTDPTGARSASKRAPSSPMSGTRPPLSASYNPT